MSVLGVTGGYAREFRVPLTQPFTFRCSRSGAIAAFDGVDRTLLDASRSWAQAPRRLPMPLMEGPNPARPVVVGVRTALIRSDAVEASAHVRYGRRSRAVAARFEIVRDRWQCVAHAWA